VGTAGAQTALGLWFLLPLVPVLIWAVADRWAYPNVLPTSWGTVGWEQAVAGGAPGALARSLAIATATAILATVAGAMAAHALAWANPPFARGFSLLLLAPVFVPPFVVVMGLNPVLLRARVPGVLGVVLVLAVAAIPYTTFLLRAALVSYDRAVEDAARTLGATRSQALLRVRLPLLTRALAGAGLVAFLVGWSDYLVTVIVGGGQLVTVPMLVAAAIAGTGNAPVAAALSIAAIAPPLLVLLAARSWVTAQSRRDTRAALALPEAVPA
jgi:putative spermidine/putrescine transport system permease protein